MTQLSEKDIELLNTNKGLRFLLREEEINVDRVLRTVSYERKLKKLQVELIRLQEWVRDNNKQVVFLFEGRDAAGKGGAIRRFTHYLNPRLFKVVALPKPTDQERSQWYFKRYVEQLPSEGQMVFFDRSWYNRAVVEPVNGFCTQDEYKRFMEEVPLFEKMLINHGIILIKLYFSISKDEQLKRFNNIINDPLKQWKYSDVDRKAQALWDEYTKYRKVMIEKTNMPEAPWKVIKANKKMQARLEAIQYVLNTIPYKTD